MSTTTRPAGAGSGAADWLASGAVHAATGTPIAVTMAAQLGAPLKPFVLAILFGANLSYATPMAYQTNLLIMSAAGYTFRAL